MLTNIIISQLPQKMVYFTGETELDLTGGQVCLIGENGQYEQALMSDPDIRCEWSSEKAGPALVNLICQDKMAQFQVIIKEPQLKRMSVQTPMKKRIYSEGEYLDLTGLRLMGEYEGGIKREIVNLPDIQYQVKADDRMYQLSIGGATVPLYFKVETAKLTAIHIGRLPNKLEYLEGFEMFDPQGGTVVCVYDNGKTEEVALSSEWVTNFSNQVPGTFPVTVQVKKLTAAFEVQIRAKKAVSLSITKMPLRTNYIDGEKIDFSGIEIQAFYDNGTASVITDWAVDTDVAHIDNPTVTVIAANMFAPFAITVAEPQVIGIAMQTLPSKLQYRKDDAHLIVDGASLRVRYNNGAEEVIGISEEQTSGFDSSRAGECQINVQYQGFTTEFVVEIMTAELLGLLLSCPPNKTVYTAGEMFEVEGLEISGFFSDGLMKVMEAYTVMPDRALEATDIAVVVEAEGKTLVVPIFVQQ